MSEPRPECNIIRIPLNEIIGSFPDLPDCQHHYTQKIVSYALLIDCRDGLDLIAAAGCNDEHTRQWARRMVERINGVLEAQNERRRCLRG